MDISKELIKYINKILVSTEENIFKILQKANVDLEFYWNKGINLDNSFGISWEIGNPGYYNTDSGVFYPVISFNVYYTNTQDGSMYNPLNTINTKSFININWSKYLMKEEIYRYQLPNDDRLINEFDKLVDEFYKFFENSIEDFAHTINNPDIYGKNYY